MAQNSARLQWDDETVDAKCVLLLERRQAERDNSRSPLTAYSCAVS
jgi:hypothetical protein